MPKKDEPRNALSMMAVAILNLSRNQPIPADVLTAIRDTAGEDDAPAPEPAAEGTDGKE